MALTKCFFDFDILIFTFKKTFMYSDLCREDRIDTEKSFHRSKKCKTPIKIYQSHGLWFRMMLRRLSIHKIHLRLLATRKNTDQPKLFKQHFTVMCHGNVTFHHAILYSCYIGFHAFHGKWCGRERCGYLAPSLMVLMFICLSVSLSVRASSRWKRPASISPSTKLSFKFIAVRYANSILHTVFSNTRTR